MKVLVSLICLLSIILANATQAYDKTKLLACNDLLTRKFETNKVIDYTAQTAKNYIGHERVVKKIYSDLVFSCYNSITKEDAELIFFNDAYLDPNYTEETLAYLLEYIPSEDISKYNSLNPNEFYIQSEELALYNAYEKAVEDFKEEQRIQQSRLKKEFHLLGFSLNSIPLKVKVLASIILLGLFILLVIKLLAELKKNESGKKAAKKKEKTK